MPKKSRLTRARKIIQDHNNYEYNSFDKKILHPLNEKQKEYLHNLRNKSITIAYGPPGTSKTLLALYIAFEKLDAGHIKKIYVASPKVKTPGELEMGALPGTLEEKSEFYLQASLSCLNVFMSPGRIEYLMKLRGKFESPFEFLPLNNLRGRSLHDAFVIVDEAQNTSIHTMYTVLSRIGKNSHIAITGDKIQRDLSGSFGTSGLEDAIVRLKDLPQIGITEFSFEDIVRSELAKEIIMRYKSLYQ